MQIRTSLRQIKQDFTTVGADFDLFRQRVSEQGATINRNYATSADVLRFSLVVSHTPEGVYFWNQIRERLERLGVVSPKGECVPDFEIREKGPHLQVGCQLLTVRQQTNLLKLLAGRLKDRKLERWLAKFETKHRRVPDADS